MNGFVAAEQDENFRRSLDCYGERRVLFMQIAFSRLTRPATSAMSGKK